MSIVYEFTVTAICPVDGTHDRYNAIIRTDEQIDAERINLATHAYGRAVIYQEALTRELHRELGVKGSLTTQGMHSGVRVTVMVES